MRRPQPRPAIGGIPAYRPGRSAEQAALEHGLEVAVKLASNEAAFPPLPSVVAAVASMAEHAQRYPDTRAGALRHAIADDFEMPAEHVTIGAGSVGLIYQLLLAYIDAGDEVLMPWPSFEVYPLACTLAGGTTAQAPLTDETADVDALLGAVTDRTRVVLIADPNNPTGGMLARDELDRLLAALPTDVVIVLDQAYHEFRDDGGPPLPELFERHPNVVVLRTFSKAHGLAGLRVGYAIGDPRLIETLDRVAVPFAVSSVAQAAAIESLRHRDELGHRVQQTITERQRVEEALLRNGWVSTTSHANFWWLPVGSGAIPLGAALERRGLVTRPFDGLGVRVTVGTPDENDQFLRALSLASDEAGVEPPANRIR